MVVAAAITPTGVRDGELATLRALSVRRGAAVLGYCEQVCQPGHALDAASEAFARFRAAVVAAPQLEEIDPEAMLLSATRHAAAARAPAPGPGPRLVLRVAGSRCCPLMPELLAARADEQLSAADVQRMERHLRRCRHCQETEQHWWSAELAYRSADDDAPAELAVETIERALRTAAPTISRSGPGGEVDHPPAPATRWAVPALLPAEPPELRAVAPVAPDRAAGEAPDHAASPAADREPDPIAAVAWPPAADAFETAPVWSGAPQPARAPAHDEGAGPVEGGALSAAHPLERDPDATMAWALDAADFDGGAASATHPLDRDPDATMAWALDAPDFDGEIVAADLRDRGATEPAATSASISAAGLQAAAALAAPHPPDAPGELAVGAGGQLRARRGPLLRVLLPLAIAAVVVLVALTLVGSLASSDHHRSLAPRPAPTVAPTGVGGAAIAAPKHPRRARARRAPTGAANASATTTSGSTSALGQLHSSPTVGPTLARAAPVPPSPRARVTPTSPARSAPHPAPVTSPPVARTSPTTPTGSGTTPSAPAGATPPSTPGTNPPGGSTSPGGAQAPAP